MNAYLDTNIIIDIENCTTTLTEIIKTIDPNISEIFYSAAHVQEAKEILGETDEIKMMRIQKRLQCIHSLTNSNYLYHNLQDNKVYQLVENPINVWETINDVPWANSIMKQFINLIPQEQRTLIRNVLGIDSRELNNYRPEEVVLFLDKKLIGFEGGLSFLEFIEKSISFHPQGNTFGLHNRFAAIFELLDMLGFWKDRYTESSNFARLWDANHAYFASFCNYFISNDKRTRNKTKVAYSIYGIKTIPISSKGK